MSFTYDLSTDLGKCRALIPDSDVKTYAFTDAELQTFIDLEGNVFWGAAQACEILGTDELRRHKVITTLDVKVDAKAFQQGMFDRAKLLRERGRQFELENGGGFDSFEIITTGAGFTQKVWNERLKEFA